MYGCMDDGNAHGNELVSDKVRHSVECDGGGWKSEESVSELMPELRAEC